MVNSTLVCRQIEYEKWQEVYRLLKLTKAVTESDCNAKLLDTSTNGLKLLEAIRQWGESLIELRKV